MLCRLLVLAVLVSSMVSYAPAQRRSGADRSMRQTTLSIRLQLANEQPAHSLQIRVELLDSRGLRLREGFASEGRLDFGPVPLGTYHVRVSGPGIKTEESPPFAVDFGGGTYHQQVRVTLDQPGSPAENTKPGAGHTISAASLNVPDKARKEFQKGGDALIHGDFEKAVRAFDKAIEVHPQFAAALYGRGVAHMELRDNAAARESFEKCVAADEHFAPALVQLANMKLGENDRAGSQQLLEKALAIDPQNPRALTVLSAVQLSEGNLDAAIATARRVHEVDHKGLGTAHYVAAQAYEQKGQAAEAAEEYKIFLKEAPNTPLAARARERLSHMASK